MGIRLLVNVPLVLVGLVAGIRLVPRSKDVSDHAFDVADALLSILGIGALVYAIIEAPGHGWRSTETHLGFVVVGASGRVLRPARTHRRASDARLRLFKDWRFSTASVRHRHALFPKWVVICFTELYSGRRAAYEPGSPTMITHAADDVPLASGPIPPGRWEISEGHSAATFSCRWVLIQVKGRFTSFQGEVTITPDPASSSVVATIDVGSVDTGLAPRDAHLLDDSFFDAEHHPTMTFRSTSLRSIGEDRWTLGGDLSVRGVSRPVELEMQVHGMATDPFGAATAWFSARGEISRADYGLDWNMPLSGGGVALGDKVALDLQVELKQPDQASDG